MSSALQETGTALYFQNAPSLESLQIRIDDSELPFKDAVQYSSVQATVDNYRRDPYGIKTINFLREAYGIADIEAFFADAGLAEFPDIKFNRGAYVGAVKSHTLQTTPYNFADIFLNARIHSELGIPTAVLVLGYGQDKFHTSAEKVEAIGKQRYFVGYDKKGHPQFTTVEVEPVAVRDSQKGIIEIDSRDDAVGHKLDDIFVKVGRPIDPRNQIGGKMNEDGEFEEYLETALGLTWDEIVNNPLSQQENPGLVSLPQFQRFIFDTVLERLRDQGIIPDQETMPIIYSDLTKISHAMVKHAQYRKNTCEILGFNGNSQELLADLLCTQPHEVQAMANYLQEQGSFESARQAIVQHHEKLTPSEREQVLALPDYVARNVLDYKMQLLGLSFDERNGLLKNDSGHYDPASYYPLFTSLLDGDSTSLNEPSWFFTNKIHRTQELLRAHGLSIPSIRVPHDEISDFDTTRIHPTGKYLDAKALEGAVFRKVSAEGLKPHEDGFYEAKHKYLAEFYDALERDGLDNHEYKVVTDAVVTDPVLAWWASQIIN